MDGAKTEGGQPVKIHDLNPPPGETAAQVVQQASSLQDQLTVERRRFSMKYGKAGESCKPLTDIRQNLQRDNNTYLRLASGQCKVVEDELTAFQLSLEGKNSELLGYLAALDPNYTRNSKEKVDSVVQSMEARHQVYKERLADILQQLSDLQKRVDDRNNALEAPSQQPTTVSTTYESPRFTPREGAPGKLADSIDPGGLSKWLALFHDWMSASYGGHPPTDNQLIAQAKLMLEPGWRERMESFPYSSGTWSEYKTRLKEILEVHYPILRRRVEYMATPARDPQRGSESPIAFANRMTKLLETAGMGTRDAFLLTYDSFLVTSILAGLAPSIQVEVYKQFRSFDIPLNQLNDFLTLLSTADNIKGQRSKVQALMPKKQNSPSKGRKTQQSNRRPTAGTNCTKCRSQFHTTEQCSHCDYCQRWGHSRRKCYRDPANRQQRDQPSTPGINTVAALGPAEPAVAAQAPDPVTGTVQAISGGTVASIQSAEPTPRIKTTLQNGSRLEILPDSGSCINLADASSLEKWGIKHNKVNENDYFIYNVSGERIPIIGTMNTKVKINNTWRAVQALVTINSPLTDDGDAFP